MKTNDLISLLVEDAPVRARLGRALILALVAGVVVSGSILLSTIGIRHNMASVFETVRVLFKIAFTLVLAITACGVVFRIGRPGAELKASVVALFIPLAMLVTAVTSELAVVPPGAWETSLVGNNARFCLVFIPVLSLAPLAGFLLALKVGAPARPSLAGATAGFAAGALAAAIYAWHCPDDSPLFVATWYMIAIAAVTAIGGLIGRRYLRW
ncbi:NrsF family protein [Rhizobium sp. Root1220]|uniref:NrsF family protein n=1 Tax=Rhizobium sp. Root1220 TaxID=1736432 RepID=UPI0006F27291|nr:NrsF family protein [Rhizobium sp. Root1220]KQV84429.1 hypothetical protein ASC90_02660 [Rhizobium sp. Root1220]